MNRFVWSRSALAIAVSACAALLPGLAHAEESTPTEDSLSLKIANALRPDRFFVRAGVIAVSVKTKSGPTVDVTGPVMTTAELDNVFSTTKSVADYPLPQWNWAQGSYSATDNYIAFAQNLSDPTTGKPNLLGALVGKAGIGTPDGITGEAADESGTAGISLGYYLDDEYKWVVETYVLAAPLSSSVVAHGKISTGKAVNIGKPIGIDGQKIITTKLVPPIVMLGRYWGAKENKLRPYTGIAAMYAIFSNTKATDVLNTYVGGSNPGDTTVSIKNSFGLGPMIGAKYQFNDQWHVSFNLGSVKLKAAATLTTRNTMVTSQNRVVKDLGLISDAIATGESVYAGGACIDVDICAIVNRNGGLATMFTKGIIADRFAAGVGDGKTLGTYVRKADTTLTSTLLMLSVGHTF